MSAPALESAAGAGFSSLPLSDSLRRVIAELGFATPTPIQAEAIPLLVAGRDLVGQSITGSGKTAAFGLPILHALDLAALRPQALVLCPTRELCDQVGRELRKLGRREAGLKVLILSGGQPMNPQLAALAKGVHLVVGTPGRVLDHLTRGTLALAHLSTVVVDEADRMLDMGFGEEMEKILGAAPKARQTVFFSATFPRSIEAMSRAHQREPVRLTIDRADAPGPQIRQVAHDVKDDVRDDLDDDVGAPLRLEALLTLLRADPPESAIVFCNLKATVATVERALAAEGVSVASLHGNLEQKERDFVMARFRNRSTRVLVATDVAARGLDLDELALVVNFELPLQPEIYVHRIGRTGRAGKVGMAISLVGPRDRGKARAIEAAIGMPLERLPSPRRGAAPRDAKRDRDAGAGGEPVGPRMESAMETLYISGGRKDKMRPGDILGALTGEAAGLQAADIGKIEIHDRFSYVAVARGIALRAVEQLSAGRIKGKRFKVGLAR